MAAKDQLKELEKRVIIGPARGEWFHLAEPDTKFNAAGDYKVTLRPTAEAMAPHFESMKEILAAALPIFQDVENEDAKKKGKKPKELKVSDSQPWINCEMEDGTVQVKLKTSATFTNKDGAIEEKNVPVVDSFGKYLSKEQIADLRIGNGTECRAVVTIRPYYMATQGVGISLRLEKVQITKLVQYGGNGVDNEFGEYEGGEFAAPTTPTAPKDGELSGESEETNYTV